MPKSFPSQGPRRCYHYGWYGHIARFCQYSQRAPPPQPALPQYIPAETRARTYKQSIRHRPLWPPEPQPTNQNNQVHSHASPLTPISPDWPPNEALHEIYNQRNSLGSQASALGELPTPSSLTFPTTTSPTSPVDQFETGGQATILADQEYNQQPSDEDDVDLWALDFPKASVPRGVPSFPILQVAEPLAASMEVTGALGLLRHTRDLPPGVSASKYFCGLDVDAYYQNISEKRDWGDVCHDPVFSFIDTNSRVISFADLDKYGEPPATDGDIEESAGDSKFGVRCLLHDQFNISVGGLSDEQEARLAALGVSGAAKPVYRDTSRVELHPPTALSQELPPWRRNEDSRFSRYFPGPGTGAYHIKTGSAQGSNLDLCGKRDTIAKSEHEGTADRQSSYPITDATNRKRSRATDFFDDEGELNIGGRSTKTRRVLEGNRSSASSNDSVYYRRR